MHVIEFLFMENLCILKDDFFPRQRLFLYPNYKFWNNKNLCFSNENNFFEIRKLLFKYFIFFQIV
jgi:hypothetical protein